MAIIWNKIIPRWGGDTIEPPEAKKDAGYIAGDKPPAKWENWLRKGTYEALDETRDVIEGIDSQLAQKAKITLSATEPAVKDINTYWYEDLGESIEFGGGGGLIMGNAGLTNDNQIWLDTNI